MHKSIIGAACLAALAPAQSTLAATPSPVTDNTQVQILALEKRLEADGGQQGPAREKLIREGLSSPQVSTATMLEEMTVTAAPFETDSSATAMSVDSVTGGDLAETSSLGAIVEEIPGVNSMSAGAQVGKPVIRGLSSNRIRILSDGVAMDHQQEGTRHPPNVDPFLSEGIEVIRGPASVLYGSEAMGGAVNVIPLEIPYADAGQSIHSSTFTTQFQTVNRQRMNGLSIKSGKDRFGITAALVARDAAELKTADVATFAESRANEAPLFAGKLPFTEFEQLNGTVGVGYRYADGNMRLRWTSWNSKQNFLSILPVETGLPAADPVGQHLANRSLQFAADHWVGDWLLKPEITHQRNERLAGAGVTYAQLGLTEEEHGDEVETDTVEHRHNFEVVRDRKTYRLGIEHPEVGSLRGEFGAEYVSVDQDLLEGDLVPDAELENWAVYGYETWQTKRTSFQLGLRFDQLHQRGLADEHRDVATEAWQDYEALSASFGIYYQLAEQWGLASVVSRGFRAPSVFELFADGVHGGVAAVQRGNPDLKEETSLNTELSLRWEGGKGDAKFAVYRNSIADYIYLRNTGGFEEGYPIYAMSQDNAVLSGFELSGNLRFSRTWSLRAAAEVIEGEFSNSGDALPLLPADNLSLRLSAKQPARWKLENVTSYLKVKVAAAQSAAGPWEPFAQFDKTPFGTASTDAYTLWGAGLSFDTKALDRDLSVNLRVDNLTDEAYVDFLDTYKGYALGAGRNFSVTVSMPL
ncbi:MAG: TonB-dependent receptor domain-containing protein [Thiotrichales bacterium]